MNKKTRRVNQKHRKRRERLKSKQGPKSATKAGGAKPAARR